MRKLTSLLFCLFITIYSLSAHAILSMELTRGVAGAIPISIIPFPGQSGMPQNLSNIMTADLSNSGRFKVKQERSDYNVTGNVNPLGGDRYEVSFQLRDASNGPASVLLNKKYTVSGNELRALAHHMSDQVYQAITGTRGIFSTKMAYVLVQRAGNGQARYVLEVADQDGYNPRSILVSTQPIMSPTWSPNGRQIAYVSFEKQTSAIFLHDVETGGRRLVSAFPGINGAPAWSPDGRKLALVLSKSGAPNIYIMNIDGSGLTQITNDFYINTEPSFSPDGSSLLFTSNRSGGPQIFQVNIANKNISRISYEGNYNARASYTRDGKYVTMIHKVSNSYNIAMLDLDTGIMKVLNGMIADSSSPSVAPNGSMILYDTIHDGRNVLAMVSADGRVQLRLPSRDGEAQDPSWSPYLN